MLDITYLLEETSCGEPLEYKITIRLDAEAVNEIGPAVRKLPLCCHDYCEVVIYVANPNVVQDYLSQAFTSGIMYRHPGNSICVVAPHRIISAYIIQKDASGESK